MRFQDIQGLESTKQKLVDAVNNGHVAHAQLFAGNEGSANLAMALAFAAYLNCENRTDSDACGVCSQCVKNEALHSSGCIVFIPDRCYSQIGSR